MKKTAADRLGDADEFRAVLARARRHVENDSGADTAPTVLSARPSQATRTGSITLSASSRRRSSSASATSSSLSRGAPKALRMARSASGFASTWRPIAS